MEELPIKSMFATLYPKKKGNYRQDDYPDIFGDMFLSFDKRLKELKKDDSEIMLFLLAFSKGAVD